MNGIFIEEDPNRITIESSLYDPVSKFMIKESKSGNIIS
jgi:hypothetical protein